MTVAVSDGARTSHIFYYRASLVMLATVAMYGISFIDRIDFAAIVGEPLTAKVDASRQFLFSSPLWFWIGHPFARLFGPTKAYAITILIGLCTLSLGLRAWLRTVPEADRPAALAAFQISPLPVVILSWLGKSDALLMGLYLLHAVDRRRSSVRFVLAAAMVLAHQEIGTVMLVSDAIVRRRILWPSLAGLVTARISVAIYLANVAGLTLTRAELGLSLAGRAFQGWATNPISHVALGIGWTWLLLFRRRQDDDRLALLACVALAYAASAVVADFTRVTALCALPLIAHLARREAADPAGRGWLNGIGVACLCLIQLQIADFDLLHDSAWPQYVLRSMRGMSWW